MSNYDVSPIVNWLQASLPTKAGEMGNGVLVWQHSPHKASGKPDTKEWCHQLAKWTTKMSKCADCDTDKNLFGNKHEIAVFSFIPDDKGVQCGTTAGMVYLVMNYPGYNICNERHKMYCTTSLDEVQTLLQTALTNLQARKPGDVSVVQLQPYDTKEQWSMTPVDAVNAACDWTFTDFDRGCGPGCGSGFKKQDLLCGFGDCCQGGSSSPTVTPLATIDKSGTLTYASGNGGGGGGKGKGGGGKGGGGKGGGGGNGGGGNGGGGNGGGGGAGQKTGVVAWLEAHWIWLAAVGVVALLLILAGVFTSSSRTRKS